MGLLRSFENGTQTDLTSLKYGNDRPGRGSSNEPYLFNPLITENTFDNNLLLSGLLPRNFSGVSPGSLTSLLPNLVPGANTDAIIRGGLAAPLHAADDVARLSRMFFDTKNIGGALFNIKQLVLSKIAPRTQRSKGIINEGGFNPANVLKQAGLGFTGLHTEKQSPIFGSITRYLDVVQDVDDTQLTQLATPSISPALPSLPDVDNDSIPDLIDPNSTNPPTVGSNSRVAGLYFIHDAGFPTKNKALKQFKVDNPNINVYSYRGGPGSVLGIGRTNLRLATDIAGAPIKVEKFSSNSFTSNKKYIGSGAEYRLIFINHEQYNFVNYFDQDNGFNTSFGGIYDNNTSFFRLATKQDNRSFLKTPSPDDFKYGNPYNYRKQFYETLNIGPGRLSNFHSLYYNSSIQTSTGDKFPIFRFDTGISTVTFGTNRTNKTSLTTFQEGNKFQYSSQQIKAKGGGGTALRVGQIPETTVGIKENFMKNVGVYTNYASPYNNYTVIDKRLNQGNPGGQNSRTAYKTGGPVAYYNNGLTKNIPNKNNHAETIAELKPALDKLNAMGVYSAKKPTYNIPENPTDDIINFNIGVIKNNDPSRARYIHFRAFLNDITDKYSSNWDSHNYVGRAENFYNYTGKFERKISTSFIVAAQSKAELLPMYKKLNFLASAIAGDYTGEGYLAGNLMELTIGGYVYRTPGFLSGINFTLKQGYPWEIGLGKDDVAGFNMDLTVSQLCHYVEVDGFDFTVIHDFLPTIAYVPDITTTRFISLQDDMGNRYNTFVDTPQTEIQQEKQAELNRDNEIQDFKENLPEDVDDNEFTLDEVTPGLQDNVSIVETENEDGTKSYEVVQNTTVTTTGPLPSSDPDKPDPSQPPTINTTGNKIFVNSDDDFENFSDGSSVFLDLDGEGFKEYTLVSYYRGQAALVSGHGLEFKDVTDLFEKEDPAFAEQLDVTEIVAKRPPNTKVELITQSPFPLAPTKVDPIQTDPADQQGLEAKSYREFRDALGDFSTISEIENEE